MSKEIDKINLLDDKINSVMKSISITTDSLSSGEESEFDKIKTAKNFIHEKALSIFTYNLKKLIQLETTQKRLSLKIGISEDLLSKYKAGSSFPSIDTLLYICKIYNIELDKFLNKPFDSKDLEHIENNLQISQYECDVDKLFEHSYFAYFFVTNTEKEGAIHEGILEILDAQNISFKILSYSKSLKKEVIIKQFEGASFSTSKLIFFNLMNNNDGNTSITMMKPNLNISTFIGGVAMLTLPSDANSKPCSQKILISNKRIDREIHYEELSNILSFKNNSSCSTFGNIKISYEDNERAYKFIKSIQS